MGIITIGGQQVYVVDSKPVAAAKASNGVGYAQLVSQQRWKLYEQAENDVLRQMEFEKMGYQAQLDVYAKQKAALTKALARAQEVKNKIATGDATYRDLISLAKADEAAESRGATVTKKTEVSKDAVSASGKPRKGLKVKSDYKTTTSRGKVLLPSERLAKLGGSTGIKSPKELEAEAGVLLERDKNDSYKAWTDAFNNRTDKALTKDQWKLTEEGAPFEAEAQRLTRLTPAEYAKEIKDSEDENDAKKQSEDYIASLESQIGSLSLPQIDFDTNVGARAREAYAGMVGMGGLGLAPRKSKTSAVYDESRAREAMARQAAGFEEAIGETAAANEADLRASLLKAAQIRKNAENARKSELRAALEALPKQAAGLGLPGAIFDNKIEQQIAALLEDTTAPTLTPEEEANIARTARQAAEQSFRATAIETGPGQRTLQSFMDREPAITGRRPDDSPRTSIPSNRDLDIFKNFALPGVDAAGFQFGGQGPAEVPPVPRFESEKGSALGTPGTTSRPPDLEDVNMNPRRRATPVPFKSTPAPAAPEQPPAAPEQPPATPETPEPPPPPPAPSGAFDLDDNNEDVDIGRLDASSSKDLYNFYAPVKMNLDTGKNEIVSLTDDEKNKIWQMWTNNEQVTSALNARESKAWYADAVEKIKSENPPTGKVKKTRLESYSSNLMNIMQKGQKLADQPTKLQRLAKLDLPEKDRAKVVPEHILLVDKLYNINSSKGNGFQTTFAEIERVYKNDDKKKKAAQEYLAAKEILTA